MKINKLPWLHEVDATTTLFLRRHNPVSVQPIIKTASPINLDLFNRKEKFPRRNPTELASHLFEVDKREFSRYWEEEYDATYLTFREQVASDVLTLKPIGWSLDEALTDSVALRYFAFHPFTKSVYMEVSSKKGRIETIYVVMQPLNHCQEYLSRRRSQIVIDLTDVKTAKELHQLLKDKLKFPDHYGENWDAFWDVITDEDGLPDELKFLGFSSFESRLPREAVLLRCALEDYQQEQGLKPCQIDY